MAKKRVASGAPRPSRAQQTRRENGDLQRASAALDEAREQLRQAETAYRRALDRSRLDEESESGPLTLGDVLDGTLEFARQHPATGLVVASLIGFLVGRAASR